MQSGAFDTRHGLGVRVDLLLVSFSHQGVTLRDCAILLSVTTLIRTLKSSMLHTLHSSGPWSFASPPYASGLYLTALPPRSTSHRSKARKRESQRRRTRAAMRCRHHLWPP